MAKVTDQVYTEQNFKPLPTWKTIPKPAVEFLLSNLLRLLKIPVSFNTRLPVDSALLCGRGTRSPLRCSYGHVTTGIDFTHYAPHFAALGINMGAGGSS